MFVEEKYSLLLRYNGFQREEKSHAERDVIWENAYKALG